MKKIRAILVDDEEGARNVFANLLKRFCPSVELLGSAANVPEAVDLINSLHPDLVFLDVQMPNFAGYEIVDFFEEVNFEIIFTTAYDEYAMKAFELSAVDYLLKPVKKSRLIEAIARMEDKMQTNRQIEDYKVLLESMKGREFEKIVIPEVGSRRVLLLKNILAIEGQGAYSIVHLRGNQQLTVSKNLKYFESCLPEKGMFFRSHKSWIINLDCLESYNKVSKEVRLAENIQAKLSKYRVEAFEAAL